MHELRHQPLRRLYLLYDALSTRLIRTPIWLIHSLISFWRPRPAWSWERSFKFLMLRRAWIVQDKVGPPPGNPAQHTFLNLKEERKSGPTVKAVWVDPVPDQIHGNIAQWAENAKVQPVRIPVYWMDQSGLDISIGEALQPNEKILYRMHGGCYVALSAHPDSPIAPLSKGFLESYEPFRRAFAIEYRLSTTSPHPPTNHFPTARRKSRPRSHPLSRRAEAHRGAGNVPPPPSALILMSPWTDLGDSHDGPNTSMETRKHCDSLGAIPGRLDYAKKAFLGPFGKDFAELNPYISPGSLASFPSFVGFPKTFINAGGAEIFLDQIRKLGDRMVADMGEGDSPGTVRYYEAPEGIHVYPGYEWFEPERSETLRRIASWLG
ncbi:hypothetical protein CONPUDRAFT_136340 [Coniophora puteana RWD-64-598 SS2]|uniref:Alpha/beta hydrolase fold-3 domain-containing protein n=1 Tax=Coniophora puteana (strain RWD-64-598) TaxID=741705 RepID=A0A5M3MW71_CONPW|nr:uncharacterized protein CONPUDRAFT_136340 [Coniophora puteana RWD-64-598 SS2]EIW83237.1 hypothetical protein CONPUDRAFT_136340 [Coniophora puteana RWD-64-598 SS2]